MSNLQMIEALCTLCEEQSRIIRAMALPGWGSWGTPP